MDHWPALPIEPGMPLTGLQLFFLHDERRPRPQDIPKLAPTLLGQALNCVYASEKNNDLLEFVGDRVLNFYTAEFVDTFKITRAHSAAVAKVVSNNDTFGRIAYCLELDREECTKVSSVEDAHIHRWDPLSGTRPPKVLADLFEAFVGAVYINHGFPKLKPWLDRIFKPIIKVATGDYLAACAPVVLFGEPYKYPTDWLDVSMQERLLKSIGVDLKAIRNQSPCGIESLPPTTRHNIVTQGRLQGGDAEHTDLADYLIDLWICNIALELWPEYQLARTKAAHLFSHITKFVSSTRVLALVAQAHSLYDLYEDPTTLRAVTSYAQVGINPSGWTSDELAYLFKYTAGWMFNFNPEDAHEWGHRMLRPVVQRAHDTLVENRSLVLVFCKTDTVELIIARDEKARDRPVVSLADMFESLSLGAEEDGRKHAKAVYMNTLIPE